MAPPSSNLCTASSTTANWQRDMDTPQRTIAHCATNQTHAHISMENARTMKLYVLAVITRPTSWSTPPFAEPPKGAAPSTRHQTWYLYQRTHVYNHKLIKLALTYSQSIWAPHPPTRKRIQYKGRIYHHSTGSNRCPAPPTSETPARQIFP
jgi:hypothetical protein